MSQSDRMKCRNCVLCEFSVDLQKQIFSGAYFFVAAHIMLTVQNKIFFNAYFLF